MLASMQTDCYCTSLRMAARRASAIYDRALEPVGITSAQWSLMCRVPQPGGEPITIQLEDHPVDHDDRAPGEERGRPGSGRRCITRRVDVT